MLLSSPCGGLQPSFGTEGSFEPLIFFWWRTECQRSRILAGREGQSGPLMPLLSNGLATKQSSAGTKGPIGLFIIFGDNQGANKEGTDAVRRAIRALDYLWWIARCQWSSLGLGQKGLENFFWKHSESSLGSCLRVLGILPKEHLHHTTLRLDPHFPPDLRITRCVRYWWWHHILTDSIFYLPTPVWFVCMRSNIIFKMANMCWLQIPQFEKISTENGYGFSKVC